MKKTYSILLFALLLSACEVTEKTVSPIGDEVGASDTSGNSSQGSGDTSVDVDVKVTSHTSGQRVSAQSILVSGDCQNSLGDVEISGDIQGGTAFTSCSGNRFSRIVTLNNFNSKNTINVKQGFGANFNQSSLDIVLFARAAFCGDGIVNQSFEVCDSTAGCDEFCQSGGAFPANLVLARVRVNSVSNQGNGSVTRDIFLGSETHSIPSGVWFPVMQNGVVFFDPQTNTFDQAPGLLARRIGSEIKLMLKTSLTASDFEHIDGRLEFHNAFASSLRNGIGLEATESGQDGFAELDPDQDEIVIESGISHFWFSETTEDDAYFTEWSQ